MLCRRAEPTAPTAVIPTALAPAAHSSTALATPAFLDAITILTLTAK
tara:strand:- start:287 stop:427 length:141 start_codon:yes stop_codon:yes gene_type:complete